MRVGAQGCPTLYKSQVILSIKDTPPVPKLCIKSEDDGILDRTAVIGLPAPDFSKAMAGVEGAGWRVGLPDLEIDLPDTARAKRLDRLVDERASQPVTTSRRGDREIQDLAFVGSLQCHHVTADAVALPRSHQKERVCHAVAKILRRPRIAENLLLDRVNGGDVVDASGTYAVRGGRGVPPI